MCNNLIKMSLKSNQCIEVERKFVMDGMARESLIACGATPRSTRTFCDVYFDTVNYDFCLNNHWLRKRDGNWELKCPPLHSSYCQDKFTTSYEEIKKDMEIIKRLGIILGSRWCPEMNNLKLLSYKSTAVTTEEFLHNIAPYYNGCYYQKNHNALETTNATDMDELVNILGCQKLAEIVTTRESYQMNGMTVDMDQTDYGYRIIEIEKIVGSTDLVNDAVKDIEELAQKIGLHYDGPVAGKLCKYFQLHQPKLLQELERRLIAV